MSKSESKSKKPAKAPAKAAEKPTTKLGEFLAKNKIDARRVVSASKSLEKRTTEDLKLIAKKAAIKAGKAEKDEAITKAKPHSGRAVTQPAISNAAAGKVVSGPVKTRIVRAVNSILVARKKAEIGLRDLF